MAPAAAALSLCRSFSFSAILLSFVFSMPKRSIRSLGFCL
jgi:hypothetical protein